MRFRRQFQRHMELYVSTFFCIYAELTVLRSLNTNLYIGDSRHANWDD